MAVLNQIAETLLSSTASVDMKTPSVKKTLYTVPTGKTMIVTKIVVRSVSATLAGGTSYAFGGTLTCSDWKSGVDLHLITGSRQEWRAFREGLHGCFVGGKTLPV